MGAFRSFEYSVLPSSRFRLCISSSLTQRKMDNCVTDFVEHFTTSTTKFPVPAVNLEMVDMPHTSLEDPSLLFEWCPHEEMELVSRRVNDNKEAVARMLQCVDDCITQWDRILMFTLNKDSVVGSVLASNTINLFANWYHFVSEKLVISLKSVWSQNSAQSSVVELNDKFSFEDFGRWSRTPEPTPVHPCSRWIIQIAALAALELLTESTLFKYTRGVFSFKVGMPTCEPPHLKSVKANSAKVKMGNVSFFESGFAQHAAHTPMFQTALQMMNQSNDIIQKAINKFGLDIKTDSSHDPQADVKLSNFDLQPTKKITMFWAQVAPAGTLPKHMVLRMLILWNCETLRQLLQHQIMPNVGAFSV